MTQPTPARLSGTAPVRYRTAKMTRLDARVTVPDDITCIVESNARDGRLCSQVFYANNGEPSTHTLQLYLCNSTTEDKDLDFSRRDEVDLVVQVGSKPVWRWSVDHPASADAHVVTVRSGTCTIWETAYPGVDQQGAALAKGLYTLRGTIDSTDAGVAATAVTTFTVE